MDEETEAGMESGGGDRWDVPAARLDAYAGPAFRKAYLAHFLAQGRRFEAFGDLRSAQYCFDRLSSGLQADVETPVAPIAAVNRPSDASHGRLLNGRLRDAEGVLARHGRRLSPLERAVYREKLAALAANSFHVPKPTFSKTGEAEKKADGRAGVPAHILTSLRRSLYRRILRSQKSVLTGGGADAVLRETVGGDPDSLVGPYNDRQNLENLLAEVRRADPAWTGEFLSHYRTLFGVRDLFGGVAPAPPR